MSELEVYENGLTAAPENHHEQHEGIKRGRQDPRGPARASLLLEKLVGYNPRN